MEEQLIFTKTTIRENEKPLNMENVNVGEADIAEQIPKKESETL